MATAVEISRKVSATRTGVTVTRVIDVEPYSGWYSVCESILGGVKLIGGALIRVPPYSDPSVPWAFADSVDVEGIGAFVGMAPASLATTMAAKNFYRRARLTIQYKSLEATENEVKDATGNDGDDAQQEIELASQSLDFGSTQLTLPNTNMRFRYSPAPNPAINPITKTIPTLKLVFARHLVVTRPINAITSLIGRINYSSFRIGTTSWPAETVRFDGATSTQKVTNLGIKFYEITYTFSIMPVFDRIAISKEDYNSDPKVLTTKSQTTRAYVGWNRVFRADRNFWDRLVAQSDDPAYQFRQMFEYDKDITQNLRGSQVSGFKLLFHPAAL